MEHQHEPKPDQTPDPLPERPAMPTRSHLRQRLQRQLGNRALQNLFSRTPEASAAEQAADQFASATADPGSPPASAAPEPPGPLPLATGLVPGLGSGLPLPPALRALFEQQLGLNLGAVRVHSDTPAAAAARDMGARAFTSGPDIGFGAGAYAPETTEGLRLLGHELAHVAQQTHLGKPLLQLDEQPGQEEAQTATPAPPGDTPADLDVPVGPPAPPQPVTFHFDQFRPWLISVDALVAGRGWGGKYLPYSTWKAHLATEYMPPPATQLRLVGGACNGRRGPCCRAARP